MLFLFGFALLLILEQTSRPHPILPLIGEGISKSLGKNPVHIFKSPYDGDLEGLFFLTIWRRAFGFILFHLCKYYTKICFTYF